MAGPAKGAAEEAPPDLEAYVDRACDLIGLPLAAEHRSGVIRNLAVIAGMARLVAAFPLAPEDEPAPVFVPAGPAG